MYGRFLAAQTAMLGRNDVRVAATFWSLAQLHFRLERWEEGRACALQTREILRQLPPEQGEQHRETRMHASLMLGVLADRDREHAKAIAFLEDALVDVVATKGPHDPLTINASATLITSYVLHGQHTDAVDLFERVQPHLAAVAKHTEANVLDAAGRSYRAIGRFSRALET
jgi:hypothetical protein